MTTPQSARSLARETLTREILEAARARLTTDGPAGLSLRAVARDVGMVSSAVYRYFPSRDALLTALLIESYDQLGAAVEDAERREGRDDVAARWRAACQAVRRWCVEHPGEFALLYGTPVPGYAAPQDTVDPATRVVRVLLDIVADAHPGLSATTAVDPGLREVLGEAREFVVARGLAEDPHPELMARTIMAWTTLFGTLSFELFGHLVGSVTDTERWFDAVAVRLASDLGIDAEYDATAAPRGR